MCKQIDKEADLMTWDQTNQDKILNGDQIKLLSDEKIKRYINTTEVDGEYNCSEVYYSNVNSLS